MIDASFGVTGYMPDGCNLLANAKVSLLVVDPDDLGRFIQVRGDAELVTDGALEHLDALYPLEQRARETRFICRIHPHRVVCDAIHRG